MSNLWLKVEAACSFATLGLACGLIPIYAKTCRQSPRRLSLLNSFSGGVFISVALIHMLAEANQSFSHWLKTHHSLQNIPLTYTFATLGFFAILFIERVILASFIARVQQPQLARPSDQEIQRLVVEDDGPLPKRRQPCGGLLQPLVLVLSLGLHSFMAGIALGVTNNRRSIVDLWIAIASHKWASAMGIGSSYAKKESQKTKIGAVLVIIFSLLTPLGVMVGVFLDSISELLDSLLTSIAVGMFLYVAVEVIGEEFGEKKDLWWKFGLLMSGFLFILATCFLL